MELDLSSRRCVLLPLAGGNLADNMSSLIMDSKSHQAELYLNGICVGRIAARGASDSWEYGEFTPSEAFSRFAPYFGAWSLLIHEDDDQKTMLPETLEELRDAEVAIDSIRAELQWLDPPQRTALQQINIDGALIEWKR